MGLGRATGRSAGHPLHFVTSPCHEQGDLEPPILLTLLSRTPPWSSLIHHCLTPLVSGLSISPLSLFLPSLLARVRPNSCRRCLSSSVGVVHACASLSLTPTLIIIHPDRITLAQGKLGLKPPNFTSCFPPSSFEVLPLLRIRVPSSNRRPVPSTFPSESDVYSDIVA